MSKADPTPPPTPHQRTYSPLAGFLSYLVPGLGQVVQGRVAKGLLFFVGLYGLFFYGMYLGSWQNVYIPVTSAPDHQARQSGRYAWFANLLGEKARFAGQFWIGVAVWPAVAQYISHSKAQALGAAAANAAGQDEPGQGEAAAPRGHPLFGTFMREPSEAAMNELIRNSDKTPDLGWMYTVIAGVLNILVIYDAFAGPAFGALGGARNVNTQSPEAPQPTQEAAAP